MHKHSLLITLFFMMMHNAVYGTGVVHVSCSSRVTLLYLVGLGQCLPTVVAQQYPHVDPILQHEGQSHSECNHVCVWVVGRKGGERGREKGRGGRIESERERGTREKVGGKKGEGEKGERESGR